MHNALVLTNGLLKANDAKTAHGLIRGTERYQIAGVIDNSETAGRDAGEILDGKHRNIPVFASLDDALTQLSDIQFLIIGVATVGGYLPPDMLIIIKQAIGRGLSIVNGLHEFLSENPEILSLATANNVQLIDIRKPKPKKDLHFWKGEIFSVKAPIIAVMGIDCAVGKRTTARLLTQACRQIGLKAEMIYTGQTGWLQGGKYGFVLDSTLNDFVSGELEHAIVSCSKETGADIIFLEGQSSLRNPSGPCGLELLLSGNAKQVVLVYAPTRKYFDDDPHWGEIPSAASEIDIIEKFGSKVIALVLNTKDCSQEEAFTFQKQYEAELDIPVLLPIEEGVEKIIPVIKSILL